jgi:hypothetical protein
MKKSILLLMLLAALSTVQAQEQKAVSKNKPSEDLENLQLGNQLAKYGYKTFSATALIEAAKIISSIETQEFKYESFTQDTAIKEQSGKKSKESYELSTIMGAAKKYADGDAKLLADISQIEKASQATRGRVGGPGQNYSYVYGSSYALYQASFREGELAEILVCGDGDTDLDLYVYDSGGSLIARDADYTDQCYVSWIPLWTGRYTIKIVNRGPILNYYHLFSN